MPPRLAEPALLPPSRPPLADAPSLPLPRLPADDRPPLVVPALQPVGNASFGRKSCVEAPGYTRGHHTDTDTRTCSILLIYAVP